jgi:cyclase
MRQLTANVIADIGEGRPNPSAIITSEGICMVDGPERPRDIYAWKEEIFKRGEPKYLINCEHHGDHIVANHFFSPPAVIISHQGTREKFASSLGSPEKVRARIAKLDPGGTPIPEDYELKPPTLTYTDRLTIYLGEQEIQVIHMPGHTPNQTVVWVPKERVMMAGGNLSCEIMPAMWGSEIINWLKALDDMIGLQPEYIIPVHGEVADLAYLRKFKGLIESWIGDVRDGIAKGWTKEEAVERINYLGPFRMRPGREPYGPEWQAWCTAAIYEELTGQPRTERVYFINRELEKEQAAKSA